MTSIVTTQGKLDSLRATFDVQDSPGPYIYLALGEAEQTLDETSVLLSECNPADGYERVEALRTVDPLTQTCTLTGVFEKANVATSTVIKTVGLTTTEIIGNEDPWFCICDIPHITKNNQLSLSVVINVQVL